MANQMFAVTNNPRLRRNQTAELNARQALLPQIIANQQRAEDITRADELKDIQIGQFNRQHALNQSRFAFDKQQALESQRQKQRASEVGFGLEAAKLGTTLSTRYGGKSVGSLVDSGKKMFGVGTQGTGVGTGTVGNFVNNLSVGSTLGGGLAGFGVSKLLGKKSSKVTKSLAGAGVGAALGLLGGGLGGGISGGFGGALGGLFG